MELQERVDMIVPKLDTEYRIYLFEIQEQFEKTKIELKELRELFRSLETDTGQADEVRYDVYDARIKELLSEIETERVSKVSQSQQLILKDKLISEYTQLTENLKKDCKSHIALKGVGTRRYNKALKALFEIYDISQKNHYKKIDSLKKRLTAVTCDILKICKDCGKPKHQGECV